MVESGQPHLAGGSTTPEAAAEKYKKACDTFFADVISIRGIPTKVLGEPEQETITSSSGSWIAQQFDDLLPKIRARRDWVVSNYKDQAEAYYSRRLFDFKALLDEFLQDPPRLAKDTGPRITPIKKEIGYFARWNGRGRDSSYPPPPAQIRTSGITAYGSYLRS